MLADEHVPRDLGPFPLSDDVRAALAELRHRSGTTGPAEIDADAVRAVEIGVAFKFPNDVLAVYAAGVRALASNHQLALGHVVAHLGELRNKRARGDLIGLGLAEPGLMICAEKKADGARLVLYDIDRRTIAPFSLADWLRERAAELPPLPDSPPLFTPLFVRKLPGGSSGRRVRHPTFGEGRVYVEIGTGPDRKVKVDFPGVGLKLLAARFLEYLD